MSKEQVQKKRGLSDQQYRKFARSVGLKIDFNKKMRMLAEYYRVSIFHLSEVVKEERISDVDNIVKYIYEYINLIGEDDLSPEGIIAAEIYPTTIESFCRFGDKNNLTKSIRKNYISEDGITLDVRADIISETFGRHFTEEDLYQFMLNYPEGPGSYQSDAERRQSELSEICRNKLGFPLSKSFTLSFQRVFNSTSKISEIVPF